MYTVGMSDVRERLEGDADVDDGLDAGGEVRGPEALFSFEGRIGRAMFWKIFLVSGLSAIVAGIIGDLTPGGLRADREFGLSFFTAAIVSVISGWISLATAVKRWHDMDRSGWMALLNAIPVLNAIALLYLAFKPGSDGPNRYGDGPDSIELF